MKITVVTVSAPAVRELIRVNRLVGDKHPGALRLALYEGQGELTPEKKERLKADILSSDCVLADLMGSPESVMKGLEESLREYRGDFIPLGRFGRQYLKLGKLTPMPMGGTMGMKSSMGEKKDMMTRMASLLGKIFPFGKTADMGNLVKIGRYFRLGDYENILNMVYLLLGYGRVKGLPRPKPPVRTREMGIRDPREKKWFSSVSSYARFNDWKSDRPTAAVLYYSHSYPNDTGPMISRICSRLEQDVNVLPIGFDKSNGGNLAALDKLLCQSDIILNFMSFRLGAGPMGGRAQEAVNMLERLDLPYLHPFCLSKRGEREWRESARGLTSSEFLLSIMLPELDGAIETFPVAAVEDDGVDEEFGVVNRNIRIIDERLDKLADRTMARLNLRGRPMGKKKIALICYNYPPGEDNMFGGAFLDTLASLEEMLKALKGAGIKTDLMSGKELKDLFLEQGMANKARWSHPGERVIRFPVEKYRDDPEITRCWGNPPGQQGTSEENFLIPGVILGNVFIGFQPSRALRDKDEASSYHDRTRPPHHQYVAYYQWLEKEFVADAMVHIGTHGTMEFLKGKESGMSGECWPDKLAGRMAHFYLYYCGNPAEAMIAKRRSHAALVSYQPPVFEKSGLYAEYAELEAALNERAETANLSPLRLERIEGVITSQAAELNLPEEINELERELFRMRESLIPKGLHRFGDAYTTEEAVRYVDQLKAYGELGDEEIPLVRNRAQQNYEMVNLIKGLEGKYLPARLAGDIFRSPEVLPAGYNLYQFDPRHVPSPSAMERGARIAQNTLDKHLKEEGAYPESVAVVAWGLEASRTQGETVGQILAYLGVRKSKGSSLWETSWELIPIHELGRPRIDTVIHICGFFRDMFENVMNQLYSIFEKLNGIEESEEDNYYKRNTRRYYGDFLEQGMDKSKAAELSMARIFGPGEGEYGTGITELFETKSWKNETDVGDLFMESMGHVYSKNHRGEKKESLYKANLSGVDIVSQVRSNHEYEVTDLDHYYEFFGGLSKSVEMVRGAKARVYISDTTGRKIETESIEKSIDRGIRTRLLNPRWIDGLLKHDYHGAQKIYERFENVMGLAATTGGVEEWIYDDMFETYVGDEELRERMKENNRHAYLSILEQMFEYQSRGYWKANEEQMEMMKQVYLDMERDVEGYHDK